MNWNHVRTTKSSEPGGLAVWLLERWRSLRSGMALRGAGKQTPKLAMLERISLAPRQTLTLVEAEGKKFLIASSAEGAPAFYPLESARSLTRTRIAKARVSW